MTRATLQPHPDDAPSPAASIVVTAERPGPARLSLIYKITGDIAAIALPKVGEPRRAERLWEHSCLEAFVRAPQGEAYYEFNFAPSREWAVWRFDGYRHGMAAALAPGLTIEPICEEDQFILRLELDLEVLQDLPQDAPWQLGLSAVIESATGNKSHWALAHPVGKPDFHHRHCFALELPPAIAP